MAVVYGSFVTGTEALTVQNFFNYQFRLYLDYSYTQDIEKNQTTITSKIYLQKISDELTTHVFFPSTFTKTIGNSTESFTTQVGIAGSYIVQISSKTRTYTHDNEGKLGNVLLSAKYNGYGPTQTGTYQPQCSVSTTIKIPDIPRASKITSNVNTIDIGSTVKLTIGELNVATYSLKLFYSLNGATEVEVGSVNSGSYDFTVPNVLLNQLPSSTSGTLSMILKTYSGSTLIGSNSVNITVNVPQSVKPTVSLSLEDVGNVPKEWGFWVQGKSRPKGTITATAGQGSSLIDNPYYSTINSNKYYTNPFTATGVLSNAGTTTIISQVTDRRGRTNSTTKNIEVVAYSSPQLTSPKVVRCDADGNEKPNGTYAKVTFNYKISPLNNKNSGSTIIYWKTKNETSFENSKTLGLSNYEGSQTIVISDYNFLVSNIYDFEVTINDYYTTTKQSLFLKAVKKPQSFRPKGKGVAFNKYAIDDGVFEIDEWDLRVNAKAKISKNVQIGTLESKNLFNKYDEVGRYYSNYQITENYIRAITELTGQDYNTNISYILDFEKYKGKTITLSGSWKSNGTVIGAVGIAYLNEAGGIPAWLTPLNTYGTEGKIVESALVPDTMPQIATKIALILYSNAGGASTAGDYVDYYDVQIEEGTIATEYTPYKKYGYDSRESMGKIVVDNITGKNLFNKNEIYEGWVRYSDNYFFTDSGGGIYYTSSYIEIKPDTIYTLNLYDADNLSSGGVMQYDAGKNWLGDGIPETQSIITFTTKSNAKYVRFVFRNNVKNKVQLEEGGKATLISPFLTTIVESGKNDLGSWIKYSDGTMECWGHKNIGTVAVNTAWGNGYISSTISYGNFPQPFIEMPTLEMFYMGNEDGASAILMRSNLPTATSVGYFYLFRASSTNIYKAIVSYRAKGYWK